MPTTSESGAAPRIYVAGHRGMVGAAIVRALQAQGQTDLITRSHAELDLCNQAAVESFFAREKPQQVYLAAARVGGIHANNTYPADFIYQNLMIEANVIHAAWKHGVERLLFLGSSCIYPCDCPQPMREEHLLSGTLEATNEPYAIAKIAGIKLCESYRRQHGCDFRSVMPTNLYGPGDNYHPQNSHVLPALLARFHEAKQSGAQSVTIWGSGTPRREFLHVDDMAAASVFVMNLSRRRYQDATLPMLSHINVGSGQEVTILEAARMVARAVGFAGRIENDPGKPDGTPRKLLDSSLLARLGWQAGISLQEGLEATYRDFLQQDCPRNLSGAAVAA